MKQTPLWKNCMAIFAVIFMVASQAQAGCLPGQKKKHRSEKSESSENLIANFPWQIAEDNVFKFKYIIINISPDSFKPSKVKEIAKTVEKYVEKYVYPNWQVAVEIEVFTPESNPLVLYNGTSLNPDAATGTYIPIYLVDEFNAEIGNDFAIAIHGNVSGSVMNGPDALTYLPKQPNSITTYPNPNLEVPALYTAIPYGTPFVVIPAGSANTGNGINGAVARNRADPNLGPTDFYQAFALALSHEVIEVLINPTGALYIGSGDPLGAQGDQIFYLQEAVDPFSLGLDNIVMFHDWPMTNFALPAYFFPYNVSGKYDLLGRSSAPFTPYKGSQFLLYQKKLTSDGSVTTDLEAGGLVSEVTNPFVIQFVLNGSIYTYTGWGLKAKESKKSKGLPHFNSKVGMNGKKLSLKEAKLAKKDASGQIPSKKLFGINAGIHARRQQINLTSAMNTAKSVTTKQIVSSQNCKNSNKKPKDKPHLLPFQYLDKDGVVTTRFKIINFIPDLLPPSLIDPITPVIEKYFNTRFFTYWNRKVSVKNYTAPDLPVFDGSFIPFYVARSDQSNLNTVFGQGLLGGAADNLNNVPNALAGPLITEYLIGIPPLPLGNPYLITNDVVYEDPLTALANYTIIMTHEMEELSMDPQYALYIATSNPPEDHAILFSQYETADPVEVPSVSGSGNCNTYAMSPFVLPSFFDAYLQNSTYDNTGLGYRALVPPMPRSQIVWQQEGEPLQVAYAVNDLDGTGDLTLWNIGNIFEVNTYEYNFVFIPMTETPLAPIYERLKTPQPLY